jgi:hypothetical protein
MIPATPSVARPRSEDDELGGHVRSSPLDAEYLLPLHCQAAAAEAELTDYLAWLSQRIDITVIDSSPFHIFHAHHVRWSSFLRHVPPERADGLNGKVDNVMTGIKRTRHERVIIADDDVRYTDQTLVSVVECLAEFDLVRPQNYFVNYPWHARWDTGRTLVNRALTADFPGTFGVNSSVVLRAGGYSADVLFENLELIRTVSAAGGRVLSAPWLYIGRLAPTSKHFFRQRVRQAYDDWAQPARLALEASLLPLALLAATRRPALLLAGVGATVSIAEIGRRRAGGKRVFPRSAALWAPVWLAERSVAVWLAIGLRARGGVRYSRGRLVRAATPKRQLRKRYSEALTRSTTAMTHPWHIAR